MRAARSTRWPLVRALANRCLRAFLLFLASFALAQEGWLQRVDEAFHFQTRDGFFRTDLSGLVDVEAYFIDQRSPGLLFGNADLFNPRLSLFLDTHLGEQFYSFVQVRADRSFDPRAMPHGDVRFDEYLLR